MRPFRAYCARPETVAASCYLVYAIGFFGLWLIYLFVGNPPELGASDLLAYSFSSENGVRSRLLASLASLCVAAVLSWRLFAHDLSRTDMPWIIVPGILLATASWYAFNIPDALLATMPLVILLWRSKQLSGTAQ